MKRLALGVQIVCVLSALITCSGAQAAAGMKTGGTSLATPQPTAVGYLKRETPRLALARLWQVWQTDEDLCRFGSVPPHCVYMPAGWWTLPYGTMPLAPLAPMHRVCHWRLRVTGGQRPGSPIVMHVDYTCGPKGPGRTIPLGTLAARTSLGGARRVA